MAKSGTGRPPAQPAPAETKGEEVGAPEHCPSCGQPVGGAASMPLPLLLSLLADLTPVADVLTGTPQPDELTRHAISVLPRGTPVIRAAALMALENSDRLPVEDEDGAIVGVITALDIVRWMARHASARERTAWGVEAGTC